MPLGPSELQAGATVVLVLLTGYYAVQTRKTVRLMSNQFRRESLRFHSQVLRKIVHDWLESLPSVTDADVDNPGDITTVGHPAIEEEVDDWEGWFWVTPMRLEGDPYYGDFLENHAPELNQVKESILELFDQFWSLRAEFIEEWTDLDSLEDLPYRFERTDWFNLWAFERAVILERGIKSEEEIKREIIESNENWRRAQHPPTKVYVGDADRKEIFRCDVLEGEEPADAQVVDEGDERVYSALGRVISRLKRHENHENVEEAAELLDQLDEKVERLETGLEEYAGMEVYEGDCEYIFEPE